MFGVVVAVLGLGLTTWFSKRFSAALNRADTGLRASRLSGAWCHTAPGFPHNLAKEPRSVLLLRQVLGPRAVLSPRPTVLFSQRDFINAQLRRAALRDMSFCPAASICCLSRFAVNGTSENSFRGARALVGKPGCWVEGRTELWTAKCADTARSATQSRVRVLVFSQGHLSQGKGDD